MTHSEDLTKLAPALAQAQAILSHASKRKENPHFRSKYADLASVWDACREALTKNGLSIVQVPSAEGPAITVSTMLLHASGQWISGALTVRTVKDDPQGAGSAITYARRYGLAAMVGVAPDDDDDGNAASQRNGQAARRDPDVAPSQDWIDALGKATTIKAALDTWRAVQAPDVWGTMTAPEQAAILVAKDAAKARLGEPAKA